MRVRCEDDFVVCVVMTSGGLLINQSLVSLVTPNQFAGGYVANGPLSLAVRLCLHHIYIVVIVVVVIAGE